MENKTMQYRKWHCPEGDKLWADLDTNAERIEFLESGQAINTGIIAPSMIVEIVSVFRRAEKAESDLAEAQEALANIDLPGMNALADMGLPEYCTLQKENAALKKRIEESHACAACPERADLAESRAVIERVREVSRNFDCTNPEKSKHELCRALLPEPATEEGNSA